MKRKLEEEENKIMLMDENTLYAIFEYVEEGMFEEAKKFIPENERRLFSSLSFRRHPIGVVWYGPVPLLHFSVAVGCREMVQYLLDGGAEIELKNPQNEWTPLHEVDDEQCCELLLHRGAKIEARDHEQMTPLLHVARRGNESVFKLLINNGANIHACDQDGFTCLHVAARSNHLSLTEYLLMFIRIDVKTKNDKTPLDIARLYNANNTIWLLKNYPVIMNLSGVISRGLTDGFEFSDFLVKGLCDPRLFMIVSQFAFQ